jgi:hypothetical protein
MKKSLILFMLAAHCVTCTPTEEECSDPTGTVTVNIPNNSYLCFKTGAIAGNCSFANSLCCSDILFDPNNFAVATSVYAMDNSTPGVIKPVKGTSSIASSGKAAKLCDIKAIPAGGFVNVMAANYDNGYVVKLADGTYARFIVTGFGTFTTGGVASVQIQYQYPFQ